MRITNANNNTPTLRLLLTKKKLRIKTLIALLLFWGLAQLNTGCQPFKMTTKAFDTYYEHSPAQPVRGNYEAEGRNIHYVAAGHDSLPMILFVHGSPGSWDAYKAYLKDSTLLARAYLVAVDRPGFGHSGYGQAEPSLARQAAMLLPLLQMSRAPQKPILVGHSLGGPLVARMAMDYPQLVGSVVMIAPSIAPELEPATWYRHLMRLPVVRQLVPKPFIASNDEILPLKGELNKMMPLWPNITAPVTVIQGTADVLVAPGNAAFARKQLVNTTCELVMLEKVNHFIPWSHYQVVLEVLQGHLTQ